MIYDIAIIGSGIIGSSIAYRLSKYDCKIIVIDKENDVANGITLANSAIVHAGHDPKEGTLKAKLNVEGSRMYPKLCQDLNVHYDKIGAFTVMVDPSQEDTFNTLVANAKARGIKYEILDGKEALAQEPNLSPNTIKVLSLPDTAIILPWEFALASLQVALSNGVKVKLNTEVTSITKEDAICLHTNNEDIKAHYVINAAGLQSDFIADSYHRNKVTLIPKKGEYFVLSHNATDFVHHVIYPMPTALGKGILAVPTVDHNIMLGPDSVEITDRNGVNTTTEGMNIIRQQVSTTLNNIPFTEIIHTFAGIRPSVANKDFIIEKDPADANFLNLLGIDSPGIASAPAIARYVEDMLKLPYSIKETYQTKRTNIFHFNQLTPAQKDEYIKTHPTYGHIICRCEQVSEGEIVNCINEPLGATSIKGVKKRVRPGMGKCQGGFCEPLVLNILARELNISPQEVLYDGRGSNIVFTKEEGKKDE